MHAGIGGIRKWRWWAEAGVGGWGRGLYPAYAAWATEGRVPHWGVIVLGNLKRINPVGTKR